MTAPKTRERELRAAVKRSGLPWPAIGLFTAMLDRADFTTAEIPTEFQPPSLTALTDWAGIRMSRAHAARMLNVLEQNGWVERKRPERPGRGHRTTYVLLLGQSLPWSEPLSDAERARRYRQRKKSVSDSVTGHATENVSSSVTARPVKSLSFRDESVSGSRDKASQDREQKRVLPAEMHEGQRGENIEGEAVRAVTPVPALTLRMVRIVSDPAWGGGVRRSHLAELMKLREYDKRFTGALWVGYRRRMLDFCGQWIVKPA